jgi:hypothetical protein
MLRLLVICIVAVIATTSSLAAKPRATGRDIDSAIHSLCKWSNLMRSGPPKSVEFVKSNEGVPLYRVVIPLRADGIRRDYTVNLRDDMTVATFMLKDWPYPAEYPEAGTVADTVKDKHLRSRLTAAADRANAHFNFARVQPPLIQRAGQSYVVTYRQITKRDQAAEEKRRGVVILHPYVSFLVTPQGAVQGTWWGTVP